MSLIDIIEKQNQHNKKTPAWISVLIFPSIILTGYWWYTFTGVFRWLANLQIDLFGSYYIYLTFVLTLLISSAPSIILSLFFKAKYKDREVDNDKVSAAQKLLYFRLNHPRIFNTYLISILIWVGALTVGLYFQLIYGSTSEVPVMIVLNEAKAVQEKTTEYISTNVIPYCKGKTSIGETGKSYNSKTYFIPLYDASGFFTYTFLEYESFDEIDNFYCADSLTTYTGIIRPDNLPGLVRDMYIKTGYLKEGESFSVLEYNGDPSSKKSIANALFVIAAISLLVFLFCEFKYRPFSDRHLEGSR